MTIALLSKPEAVQAAIAECDELGLDAFLDKYGFSENGGAIFDHGSGGIVLLRAA